MRTARLRLLAALLTAMLGSTACVGVTAARQTVRTTPPPQPLCGSSVGTPVQVTHVVWIWMENRAYDRAVSPQHPVLTDLAQECGLATDYHALVHGSLLNYLGAVSGQVLTFHDRCQTRACPEPQLTLFEQVAARGLEWRAYEGGMAGNCALESSGLYMVRHNPAAYFTRIRSDCARWDVPIGTPTSGELASDVADDTLPAFAFITPDACDDMHNCPVAAGEKWLQTWLPRLAATSSYRNGRVAVFVTWDEGAPAGHIPCAGADDPTCRVATFVLSPYTRPGARTARVLSHFSLLQAAERLLGLKLLGGAAAANGMLAPFGLR